MKVGTRGSKLALAQTAWVIERLAAAAPSVEFVSQIVTTKGDRKGSAPVLGDGIFVKEIQHALLSGEVDLTVHSLKDMPTEPVKGIVFAAIPEREDARDALVGGNLEKLPEGARVGTGSGRRSAQLKRLRPDLVVVGARGNVPTRIEKIQMGEYEAVMLAAAGLSRLGIKPDHLFGLNEVLPAPGQGALAIEVREGDDLHEVVSAIHREDVHVSVVAERHLLRSLGGGCLLPVGAHAHLQGEQIVLEAAVTSDDGENQVRAQADAPNDKPLVAANRVARELIRGGAKELLRESSHTSP